MTFELLIARYGLLAVALGAGIEGESAVMAGGVLAHQHLVALPGVVFAAAAGSFAADQGFFLIGRHFRQRAYVKKVLAKPAAHRAIALLERHPTGFILAIRFLYGIRTLSPIAVGTSAIAQPRFVLLNAIAAIVWASLFAAIGYELGGPLKSLFAHLPSLRAARPGVLAIAVLAITVVAFLIAKFAGRHLHHRRAVRSIPA